MATIEQTAEIPSQRSGWHDSLGIHWPSQLIGKDARLARQGHKLIELAELTVAHLPNVAADGYKWRWDDHISLTFPEGRTYWRLIHQSNSKLVTASFLDQGEGTFDFQKTVLEDFADGSNYHALFRPGQPIEGNLSAKQLRSNLAVMAAHLVGPVSCVVNEGRS